MSTKTTTAHSEPTKKEELKTFLFLTALLAPILSIAVVGGYGFMIWILQIINGPPTS